jgi:hypothetical protein
MLFLLDVAPPKTVHFVNLHIKFITLVNIDFVVFLEREVPPSLRRESNYYCIKFPCIFIEIVFGLSSFLPSLVSVRVCVCVCVLIINMEEQLLTKFISFSAVFRGITPT